MMSGQLFVIVIQKYLVQVLDDDIELSFVLLFFWWASVIQPANNPCIWGLFFFFIPAICDVLVIFVERFRVYYIIYNYVPSIIAQTRCCYMHIYKFSVHNHIPLYRIKFSRHTGRDYIGRFWYLTCLEFNRCILILKSTLKIPLFFSFNHIKSHMLYVFLYFTYLSHVFCYVYP